MRLLIYSFFFFLSFQVFTQNNVVNSQVDSIYVLRALSQDTNFSLNEKLKYAIKSSNLARLSEIDTSILKSNRNLSLLYFFNQDYDLYAKLNHQNLKLAAQLNDSIAVVVANHNLGIYHDISLQNDSAFFYYSKSRKLYNALNNKVKEAEMLINIASIQELEKDYFGSEESAVKAIKILNTLPNSELILDQLWILNNLIGNLSLKLGVYDKALEYHDKALEISDKMIEGYFNSLYSINNQAIVYKRKGDLDKAIILYQSIINEKNLKTENPSFYALTLGNYAYTKSLKNVKDITSIEAIFNEAYKISDSLQDPITKLGVTIDMSRFYLGVQNRDLALKYATETYKLAKETSSNDVILESLLILSKLNKGETAKQFLNEHIKLSDSLLKIERNVRNKFARIEFETDQLELENQRISQQRMWLLLISTVLLITLFLLYIIVTQRAKNKELKLKQDQQEANEEIYNLMLSQQDKLDGARAGEKKRISEELHDGVLGRLFGTRLSLDTFNNKEGKDAIQTRSKYINELKTIEEDIRKISHDLNTDFVSGSGFMDILSELIDSQTQAYKLKYTFNYTDDISWDDLTNKTKINIYRILQESLQNIYKHAEATQVIISIQLKNDVICVSISDDGKGFDISKSKKGIGHKNINSRANQLEGRAIFNSEINSGTIVTIEIPYTN